MKALIMSLFLVATGVFLSVAPIHAQTWLWAKAEKNKDTNSFCDPYGIVRDNSGNVFETGTCGGTATFSPYSITCIPDNDGDIFLSKYDASGNVLWVKNAKGTPNNNGWYYGISVATDASGNAFVTGSYGDTVQFGNDTLFNTNAGDGLNVFLTKYDANGNVLWAENGIPKTGSDGLGYGVTTDATGNVYIIGVYYGHLTFGTYNLYSPNPAGTIFLAKFDANGNPQWAKGMGIADDGFSFAIGSAIMTDKLGNVYISGFYRGDSVTLDTYNLPYVFNNNVFLAKYTSAGNVIWVKTAVPAFNGDFYNSEFEGTCMTSDAAGNIYIGGGFTDSISFGTHTVLNKKKNGGLFLVKYDTAGNVKWAKGGTSAYFSFNSFACSLTSDNVNNNIYMCGTYFDTLIFGATKLITTAVHPSYILMFDTSGNTICGTSIENNNDDFNGVAADPATNSIYFNGDVYGTIDSTYYCTFGVNTLSGTGLEWGFMSKWSCSPASVNELDSISNSSTSVYPNPNNGRFTIKSSGLSGQSSVQVYNMLGEKVYSEIFPTGIHSENIDISSNPAGIYLYRVLSEKGALVGEGKFIIQQ